MWGGSGKQLPGNSNWVCTSDKIENWCIKFFIYYYGNITHLLMCQVDCLGEALAQ